VSRVVYCKLQSDNRPRRPVTDETDSALSRSHTASQQLVYEAY